MVGAVKYCRYGTCNSDSRPYRRGFDPGTRFFRFPKPCLEFRKCGLSKYRGRPTASVSDLPKNFVKTHIRNCKECSLSNEWVRRCRRVDIKLTSIADITKDSYICSKHFEPGVEQIDYEIHLPDVTVSRRWTRRNTRGPGIPSTSKQDPKNPDGRNIKTEDIPSIETSLETFANSNMEIEMKHGETDGTGRNSLGWDTTEDEKHLYCELKDRCDDVDPRWLLNPSKVKDEPAEEHVETVSLHRDFAEGDGIKLEFCNNIQSYELHGADPQKPLTNTKVKEEPVDELIIDDIPYFGMGTDSVSESLEISSEAKPIKQEICGDIQELQRVEYEEKTPLWPSNTSEVKDEPMEVSLERCECIGGNPAFEDLDCSRDSSATETADSPAEDENTQWEPPDNIHGTSTMSSPRGLQDSKERTWIKLETIKNEGQNVSCQVPEQASTSGTQVNSSKHQPKDSNFNSKMKKPLKTRIQDQLNNDCSHSEMLRSQPSTPACENENLSDPNIIVQLLVEKDFKLNSVSIEEQNKIILAGRATPVLRCHPAEDGSNANGILARWEYEVIPWLTALRLPKSWKTGNYHCWPCLLFAKETKQFCCGQWYPRWTLHGGVPRHTFWEAINEHSANTSHQVACRYLKLRESEVEDSIESEYIQTTREDLVKSNRNLLALLIRTLCFTNAKFGNTEASYDRYLEIMSLVISFYPGLQQSIGKPLNEETLMNFISKHACKVLPYVDSKLTRRILLQFRMSEFVSIIYEDTKATVDESTVIAVIIRYLTVNGYVSEIIAKFAMLVDSSRNSNVIYKLHKRVVFELGIQKKLVGVTFSGTVLAPQRVAGFLYNVSKASPKAIFFHHPDHNLKEVLLQSLSHLEECRHFLQTIADLVKFLAVNGALLSTFIGLNKPNSQLDEEKCFSVDIVTTLRNYFPYVIEFFSEVLQNLSNCKGKKQALTFKKFFEEPSNRFLIAVIAAIMDAIDELSRVMENYYDPAKWTAQTQKALDNLVQLKENRPEYFMYLSSKSIMQNHSDHDYTHWVFTEEEMPKSCRAIFRRIIETATICVVQRAQNSWIPYLDKKYDRDPEILRVVESWNIQYGFVSSNESHNLLMFFKILTEIEPGMKLDMLGLNPAALKQNQISTLYHYFWIFLEILKDTEPNLMEKSVHEIAMAVSNMDFRPKFRQWMEFLRFCALTVLPAKSNPSSPSTVLKLKSYLKNSSDSQLNKGTSTFNVTEALLFLAKDTLNSAGFVEEVVDQYAMEENNFLSTSTDG